MEHGSLLNRLRQTPGKTHDQSEVTQVEQEFADGRRVTLKVEKISNGFLVIKETYTPMDKHKNRSEITDSDYSNQHKTATLYVKNDPRIPKKSEEKEDLFSEFLLDTNLTPAG